MIRYMEWKIKTDNPIHGMEDKINNPIHGMEDKD
jgi:hypothetical protein